LLDEGRDRSGSNMAAAITALTALLATSSLLSLTTLPQSSDTTDIVDPLRDDMSDPSLLEVHSASLMLESRSVAAACSAFMTKLCDSNQLMP